MLVQLGIGSNIAPVSAQRGHLGRSLDTAIRSLQTGSEVVIPVEANLRGRQQG